MFQIHASYSARGIPRCVVHFSPGASATFRTLFNFHASIRSRSYDGARSLICYPPRTLPHGYTRGFFFNSLIFFFFFVASRTFAQGGLVFVSLKRKKCGLCGCKVAWKTIGLFGKREIERNSERFVNPRRLEALLAINETKINKIEMRIEKRVWN